MPVYLFWGEDEFLLQREVQQLRSQLVNDQWSFFNYSEYPPNLPDSIPQALADLNTPPVGTGKRLIYLPNSTLLGACPNQLLQQLEDVLPKIPDTNVLLLGSINKPDSRNKSVKLLLKYATVKEFPLIAQWQTDVLTERIYTTAREFSITIANNAACVLAESVGNNTRLLHTELEKLKIYTLDKCVSADDVRELVSSNAANSLQLAAAIRTGNVSLALELLEVLLRCNEPALKIVATLTTTFRTWLIIKLCIIAGWKDDTAIAHLAEVKNPKRLYFLKKEVTSIDVTKLQNALNTLLELETMLKTGAEEKISLQSQIIKICT